MIPKDILMIRAIQLAKLARSKTRKNPKVAAIIFNNKGEILGEGYHKKYGDDHAEVRAVKSLKKEINPHVDNLNIMVTLEPCNHHGKTPPCVDLIKNNNFNRAIIGSIDPNPQMAGKSLETLQKSDISVERSNLESKSNTLLHTFKTNITINRPYIYLKMAVDEDNICGDKSERIQITDSVSQFFSHKIRSEVNAILVGRKTAQMDNPSLTNRLAGGPSPLRIIIDLKGVLSSSLMIFNDKLSTLYFTRKMRTDLNEETEVKVTDLKGQDLIKHILDILFYEKNVGSLLVEGGKSTINTFIENDFWDELLVFRNHNKTGCNSPIYFNIPHSKLDSKMSLYTDTLSIYRPLQKC